MASVQDFIKKSQTRTVQHNHVIYPISTATGPSNNKSCFRNIGVRYKNYAHKNVSTNTIYPKTI